MDEYLPELLAGHEKRQLDAVMQLRDQFAHASRHAAAIDPALRSALQQFLGHLSPERLATGKDAAANWNRYRDVYGNLLQASGGRLPHLFLEALAQAYQEARGKGLRLQPVPLQRNVVGNARTHRPPAPAGRAAACRR